MPGASTSVGRRHDVLEHATFVGLQVQRSVGANVRLDALEDLLFALNLGLPLLKELNLSLLNGQQTVDETLGVQPGGQTAPVATADCGWERSRPSSSISR